MRRLRLVLVSSLLLAAPLSVATALSAATFTVKNTNDSGTDSFRQAILGANGAAGADTIDFAIPAAGVQTITLLSTLPQITDQVTIDGYTQPGASANTLAAGDDAVLRIVIDGNAASVHGLYLFGAASGGSIIRGLALNGAFLGPPGLTGAAIRIEQSDDNQITGNFVGVAVDGATAAGGVNGIQIVNGSGNTIGGSTPAERNLVSGNVEGIEIRTQFAASGPTTADSNEIFGNYIGTDAAGTATVPNVSRGIHVDSQVTRTAIGSTTAGTGNLISGNFGAGIELENSTAADVRGNLIGTNRAGTSALPNGNWGIVLSTGASDNQIGGSTAAERNVISGNTAGGIRVLGSSLRADIRGNFIGLDTTGAVALGNGGPGIFVNDGANDASIGGSGSADGNVIAFNAGQGVAVGDDEGGTGVLRAAILGDRIFANGALGIDLAANGVFGVTPNDPDPGVGKPNLFQNFPVLNSAVAGAGTVAVSGTLTSAANGTFRVELFGSSACDASGNGEGERYLGFTSAATNGSGNASFGPVVLALPPGLSTITATATDADGNTSEFSSCLGLGQAPTAAIPALSPVGLGVLAGALAVLGGWVVRRRRAS